MTDEQVFMQALQEAYEVKPLAWWMNSPRPYLVFDASHEYDIEPNLFETFSVEIKSNSQHRVGVLQPTLAAMQH